MYHIIIKISVPSYQYVDVKEFFISANSMVLLLKKAKNHILSTYAWDEGYKRYYKMENNELGLPKLIDQPFDECYTIKYDIKTEIEDVYAYFGKKHLVEA